MRRLRCAVKEIYQQFSKRDACFSKHFQKVLKVGQKGEEFAPSSLKKSLITLRSHSPMF
jgi:hypothetical protein